MGLVVNRGIAGGECLEASHAPDPGCDGLRRDNRPEPVSPEPHRLGGTSIPRPCSRPLRDRSERGTRICIRNAHRMISVPVLNEQKTRSLPMRSQDQNGSNALGKAAKRKIYLSVMGPSQVIQKRTCRLRAFALIGLPIPYDGQARNPP